MRTRPGRLSFSPRALKLLETKVTEDCHSIRAPCVASCLFSRATNSSTTEGDLDRTGLGILGKDIPQSRTKTPCDSSHTWELFPAVSPWQGQTEVVFLKAELMEMSGRGKELEKNVQRKEKNSLFLNVTVTSGGTVAKNLPANAGNTGNIGSIPGSGRFPWRMKWQPIQYSLHAKFHGQRSLAGYSPWSHKELDTTKPECTVISRCFIGLIRTNNL